MRSRIEIDGRPYELVKHAYAKGPANPVPGKTSTGTQDYDDQDNWNHFSHEDWSGGIGGEDEDQTSAAFIYGDARYSRQLGFGYLMVPHGASVELDTGAHMTSFNSNSEVAWGPADTISHVSAVASVDPANTTYLVAHMMVRTPGADVVIDASLYEATSSTDPTPTGSALDTTTFTVRTNNIPGPQYITFNWEFTAVGSTRTVLVLAPRDTLYLIQSGGVDGEVLRTSTDGITYSAPATNENPKVFVATYDDPDFMNVIFVHPSPGSGQTWMGNTEGYIGQQRGWYDGVAPSSTRDTGITEPVLDITTDGADVWVAYGDSHDIRKYSTGVWSTLAGSVKANRLHLGGGYLWRCTGNSVFYTANETTWTEVDVNSEVIDIIHWNGSLHFLTKKGLGYNASGDVPLYITENHPFEDNAFLREFQGNLYIVNNHELLEYDGSNIRNIAPGSRYAMPREYAGLITAMASSNSHLYIGISASSEGSASLARSGIYAWNGTGWSCLNLFGSNCEIYDIILRTNQITSNIGPYLGLEATTSDGHYYSLITEMRNRSGPTFTSRYMTTCASGFWVETHWIYGGFKALDKDWNAISYAMDRSSPSLYADWDVEVYYKTDENGGWSLLDNSNYRNEDVTTELPFPMRSINGRPGGKRIKIGIRAVPREELYNDTELLKLRLIDVEYHPKLNRRWRWNMTLSLREDQVLAGESENSYSLLEQIAHIEETVMRLDAPFTLTDMDGNTYWVKTMEARFQPVHWEMDDGVNNVYYHVPLVLDQVTDD